MATVPASRPPVEKHVVEREPAGTEILPYETTEFEFEFEDEDEDDEDEHSDPLA